MIKELWEKYEDLIKEFLRVILLGAYSAGFAWIVSHLEPLAELNPTGVAFIALAVLRAIDRQIHESGVAEKGLTRF